MVPWPYLHLQCLRLEEVDRTIKQPNTISTRQQLQPVEISRGIDTPFKKQSRWAKLMITSSLRDFNSVRLKEISFYGKDLYNIRDWMQKCYQLINVDVDAGDYLAF